MRPPEDMPRGPFARRGRRPGRSGRGRVVLIVALVVVFLLLISLRAIASFYTDYLWFKSIGQTTVWRGVLGTKIVLAIVFIALFFVLMWVNLLIADRLAPRFRPAGPEEELIERYHELVGGRTALVRIAVSALFALIAGAGASGQWNEWLLFRNHQSFGVSDPQFHKDVGFYVFQLPFINFVVGWLFAAFTIIFIVTAVEHYMNGGIRVQTPVQRVTPQVKAHLSVLLAVLALIKLVGYYYQQFSLTTSTRGTVDGATYTDVHVQLRAIQLLALISLAAAILFIVNIWLRGWVLPALGVGLWALIAVLAGGILPALVQRFQVQPAESSKERPYIQRNIDATRQAFGLDDAHMKIEPFANDSQLSTAALTGNSGNLATIDNVRLWDPDPNLTGATFTALQRVRSYYDIKDVDVDRYVINGQETQVNIATRELNTGQVPQQSWEATHLAFTHGYGVVAAPSNAQTTTGQPAFTLKDIPVVPSSDIPVTEPDIYFGEGLDGYVIVNTKRQEIDFQRPDGSDEFRSYSGQDGIGIGSLTNKIAFALRFGDINPLVSGNLTGSSKILINRSVRARLQAIAPFLSFDGDPYPVVVDGRVKWIDDAFTTTDAYPYSQRAITDDVGNEGLNGTFNYVRNSVKAVVDAYAGTVTLYVVDRNDPIVRAYQKAFPKLFTTDAMPAELQSHLRYPEEMFRVQTNMWGRYHQTDPDTFYNQSDGWNVAPDPGQQHQVGSQTPTPSTDTGANNANGTTAPPQAKGGIPPYYQLMQLPGDSKQTFVLLRSFVPVRGNNQQMTAFMVASSDPGSYGQLRTFEMPNNNFPPSPGQAAATMSSDTDVASLQTLLGVNTGGSDLFFGNLLTIPINQSLLYVRPVYVQAHGTNSIPLLRRVVVEFNNQVAVAPTLGAALRQLTPFADLPQLPSETPSGDNGAPPTTQPTPPGSSSSSPPENQTVAQLLADANAAMDAANAALTAGDLATYQAKVNQAAADIKQAQAIVNGSSTTTTTTTSVPGGSA